MPLDFEDATTPRPSTPTTGSSAAPDKSGAASFDAAKIRGYRRNEKEIPYAAKVSFVLGLGTLFIIFVILGTQAYLRHRELEDLAEAKRQQEALAHAPKPVTAPTAPPARRAHDGTSSGGGGGGGGYSGEGGGKIPTKDSEEGLPMPSSHYAILHSLKSLLYDARHEANRSVAQDPTNTFPPGALEGCPPESLNNLEDARLGCAHYNITLLRIVRANTIAVGMEYVIEAQATAPDGTTVVSRGAVEIGDGSDDQAVLRRVQAMTPFAESVTTDAEDKPAEPAPRAFRGLPPPPEMNKTAAVAADQPGYPLDIR